MGAHDDLVLAVAIALWWATSGPEVSAEPVQAVGAVGAALDRERIGNPGADEPGERHETRRLNGDMPVLLTPFPAGAPARIVIGASARSSARQNREDNSLVEPIAPSIDLRFRLLDDGLPHPTSRLRS
jgi:hypothetical protein